MEGIKLADKGGPLVVMNRSEYFFNCLITCIVYPQPDDLLYRIKGQINKILNNVLQQEIIDEKLYDYIHNISPNILVFYVVPKIHKKLEKPPRRPIVASMDFIFTPLSILLEKILAPLVKTSCSFGYNGLSENN